MCCRQPLFLNPSLPLEVLGERLRIQRLAGGFLGKLVPAQEAALEAQREQGKSPLEAIREACLLRFRPIMMTTFAALGGGLPLALGTGAGSELRRPLGIAIVGGLLVSQWLTLYSTPVVYLYLDRLARRFGRKHQERSAAAE